MNTATRRLALFVLVSSALACNGDPAAELGEARATLSDAEAIVETAAIGTLPGHADVTPDGNFTYAIPIQVPPGRAGMQPSLSVQYGTGGGEGPLGVGFALQGMSAISRCPRSFARDGVRRGVELTDDDRLCLDGDRLVAEPGSVYGRPGASYRLATDALRRIREIARDTDGVRGPAGFRVELPDGRRRTYGRAQESRIEVPIGDTRVAETWLLDEETDRAGNRIDYHYEHLTPSRHELGDDVVVGSLVRIASIVYTGFGADEGDRRVDFVYSERARTPSTGMPLSPDGSSGGTTGGGLVEAAPPDDGFRHGVLWQSAATYPLQQIRTSVRGQLVHEYRFRGSDDPTTHRYRLNEIQLCTNARPASGKDEDESGLVCLPPTQFSWRNRPTSPDVELDPRYSRPTFERWDVVVDRFARPSPWRCGEAADGSPMTCSIPNPVAVLDMNGDGADDLFHRETDTATGPAYGVSWGVPSARATRSLQPDVVPLTRTTYPRIRGADAGENVRLTSLQNELQVIDWNLDGLDDLIVLVEDLDAPDGSYDLAVLISDGQSFDLHRTGTQIPYSSESGTQPFVVGMEFADVDGDGRKDMLVCEHDFPFRRVRFGRFPGEEGFEGWSGHWSVALRDGDGFTPLANTGVETVCEFEYGRAYVSSFNFEWSVQDSPAYPRRPVVGDFDGDGTEELLIADRYTTPIRDQAARLITWDDEIGGTVEVVTDVPPGPWTVIDVNGDGLHDLVRSHFADQNAGCSTLFTDRESTCPDRRVSTGILGRFVDDSPDYYLPGRSLARTSHSSLSFDMYLRMTLPALGFDINGDGRGDLLARTLPRGGTMVVCDDSDGRRCGIIDDGWRRWADEEVWAIESLTSGANVAYPTPVVIDGLRRKLGNGTHDYWRADTLPLDADGDGALDFVQFIDRDAQHAPRRQPPLALFHNVRVEPALIERVTDGLGARVEVEYGNLSDRALYTPSRGCTYPQRCVTDSRTVVRTLRRDDGLKGLNDTSYTYVDGRVDLQGGGWIGFAEVHVEHRASGVHVDALYDNRTVDPDTGVYPFATAPTFVRTWRKARFTSGTSVVSEANLVETQRVVAHPLPGVLQVRTTRTTTSQFESMAESLEALTPSTTLEPTRSTTTWLEEFDDFGFARTQRTSDGLSVQTVETEWTHDRDGWLLGRPTYRRTRVSNGDDFCERDLVERLEYDWELGRVIESVQNPDDPATRVVTQLHHDAMFRNLSRITTRADGAEDRSTAMEWSADGYFPAAIENTLGHRTKFYFEPSRGLLYETISPLGLSSRQQWDGFGRAAIASADGGPEVSTRYQRTGAAGAAYEVRTTSTAGGQVVEHYDHLGRPISRERRAREATIRTELAFDTRGRIEWASEPHTTSEGIRHRTVFHYDDLDRLRRVETPIAGREMRFWYEPRRTYSMNALGHVWTQVEDRAGRLERLVVPGGIRGGASYSYCAAGEIRRAVDELGNVSEVRYDLLGRRTELIDPDAGRATFEYDALGQLRRMVDAEQRVTRFDYDVLGRTRFRWREADGLVDEWEWDTGRLASGARALGLLHWTASGDGVRDELEYDELGRLERSTRSVHGFHLSTEQQYDAFGRPARTTYPTVSGIAPVVIEYRYDDLTGQLTSLLDDDRQEIWSLVEETPRGQPSIERLGPIERRMTYGPTGEIATIDSVGPKGVLQDLEYRYERRGLLERRIDALAGRIEIFTHDALARLRSITEAGVVRESYSYDESGNLLRTHDSVLSYPGHRGPRPHAASSIRYADGRVDTIDYNAAGEALRVGDLYLEHNQLGLPRHAHNGREDSYFLYDSSGARARRVGSEGKTTYYGAWELEERGAGAIERVMIAGPSGTIAQIETVSEGPSTRRRTRWLLTDRQGSVETSWTEGDRPEHHRYDAFGGVLDDARRVTGDAPGEEVRSGYTGHEHDRGLGVINMRGRWFHPLLRRFLSPDPLSGGDGQRLNRYSYVRNSPFAMTDPTGWNDLAPGRWYTEPAPHSACRSDGGDGCEGGWEAFIGGGLQPGGGANNDSGAAERAGTGASGSASNADAPVVMHLEGPPVGVPVHVPDGYGGGEPPGRDTEEAIAAGRGFAEGVAGAFLGGAAVMGVGVTVAALSPLLVTGAALYMGFATLTGAGDAYDGFLETFEKASVPNAPLEYHQAAGAALGGLMGSIWAGAVMEAGLGLAAPIEAELSTITAETVTALDGGGGATAETVFYRLITHSEPVENFVSNAARGLRPRGPEISNPSLHTGLSMFDTIEGAASRIPVLERSGRVQVLGIGEVRIPQGAVGVSFEPTLGPGHYTVTGASENLAAMWRFTWFR